jgi:hypothetical protein
MYVVKGERYGVILSRVDTIHNACICSVNQYPVILRYRARYRVWNTEKRNNGIGLTHEKNPVFRTYFQRKIRITDTSTRQGGK